jgi:26S proteasome regulatory subunit N3
LDSSEDVEHIIAKAIKDGILDATINHEEGYIQSKVTLDVYSTEEPTKVFHSGINFCIKIRNSSIKAMRFPPSTKTKEELEKEEVERKKKEEEYGIEEPEFDDEMDEEDF